MKIPRSDAAAPPPRPTAPYWQQPLPSLVALLDSGEQGLDPALAARRLAQTGPNETAAPPRRAPIAQLLRLLANPLILVLLGASALAAIAGDVASFVIVALVIGLSVLLDFTQETRARTAVDALRSRVAVRARVVRGGRESAIDATDLVPGDIVLLAAGDLVPADARLLDADALSVNEALLTGESYPVGKTVALQGSAGADAVHAQGCVLAGTTVVSGHARALVCRTAASTVLGGLARTLHGRPSSAFESGLLRFSGLVLRITVLLVTLVLGESLWFHRGALESMMFALALAVGLTPALLPMILTVTLARGAMRMAGRGVIVKRLAAIHDLGAMDVLCADKTGTLTAGSVRMLRAMDADGRDSDRVFELAWLNSHFETGLKSLLDQAILDHASVDASAWRKIDEVHFDFERRRVSVLLARGAERLLIVKGAPEDLLRLSTSVATADGGAGAMDRATRRRLQEQLERLGEQGCRSLAVAYRAIDTARTAACAADESSLVFAGFTVFMDPPKTDSVQAIEALAGDGVAVKVLTGDNERVACHVCEQLAIPVQGVLLGEQLEALSEEALRSLVLRTTLFCRVTPAQKLRVLLALRHGGKVVGFLGDGVNDAPSIQAADVGMSVDSAADVARAAADIVLTRPDLSVLHEGVLEGRRTILNVDKYILLASSANFGNIVSMALAGLVLPFLPLLPIQVLLTNLLYDLAQLGLPFDAVDREDIAAPIHWDLRFIERFMLSVGPISTLFDALTFAVLLFVFHAGEAQFRTGWFVESLATQLLMTFAVRTRRPIWASRPHAAVAALALAISALTMALPFLSVGRWFAFVPLDAAYFRFLALVLGAFLLVTGAAKRLVMPPRRARSST